MNSTGRTGPDRSASGGFGFPTGRLPPAGVRTTDHRLWNPDSGFMMNHSSSSTENTHFLFKHDGTQKWATATTGHRAKFSTRFSTMSNAPWRKPRNIAFARKQQHSQQNRLGLEQIYRQLERPAEAPTTTTTKSTPPEQRPTSSKPTATRVPEAQPLSAQDATDVKRTARIPTVDASSTSPSARLQRIVKVLAEKEVEYNAEMAKGLSGLKKRTQTCFFCTICFFLNSTCAKGKREKD